MQTNAYQTPITVTGKTAPPSKGQAGEEVVEHAGRILEEGVAKKLTAIWQELLGLEAIGPHDNFFQLGADSMITMKAVSRARSEGFTLQPKDLFIHQTICKLSRVVAGRMQLDHFIDLAINSGDHKSEAKTESVTEPRSRYLIPLKTEGSKSPIFIVCGAGGSALRFRQFANMLDEDQPVYALQPPMDEFDLSEFPLEVETIAACFVAEILAKDPVGPYALSGHCSGGIIALEMALQMEAMGKQLHTVAMFDTIVETANDRQPPALRNLYGLAPRLAKLISGTWLKLSFETYVLRTHPKQAFLYKLDSIVYRFKHLFTRQAAPQERKFKDLEIFDALSGIYINACKNYTIRPYAGNVILYYARDHYHFVDREQNIWFKKIVLSEETKNTWKRYLSSVTIYEVEGEHSDIFDPLHCREFAESLQSELDLAATHNKQT